MPAGKLRGFPPLPPPPPSPALTPPTCSAPSQLTLSSLGADPTGNASAVATLERVEQGLPGMHFVSAGRYRIERNVTLTKPVVMDANATFWLGPAATLVMLQPLTAPAQQVFAGPGRVEIRSGVSLLPEWWGEWRAGRWAGAGEASPCPLVSRRVWCVELPMRSAHLADRPCPAHPSRRRQGQRAVARRRTGAEPRAAGGQRQPGGAHLWRQNLLPQLHAAQGPGHARVQPARWVRAAEHGGQQGRRPSLLCRKGGGHSMGPAAAALPWRAALACCQLAASFLLTAPRPRLRPWQAPRCAHCGRG